MQTENTMIKTEISPLNRTSPLREEDNGEGKRGGTTRKTVLLVDDDAENLSTLGEILRRLDYEVLTRLDAREALSALRGGAEIDLVITDYRMPEMDGLEFIVQLHRVLPDIPVIMMTGYGEVEVYLKSRSLGVFEYMNKPVRMKDLSKVVQAALEGN